MSAYSGPDVCSLHRQCILIPVSPVAERLRAVGAQPCPAVCLRMTTCMYWPIVRQNKRMRLRARQAARLLLTLCALIGSSAAWAALGGAADSVLADRVSLQAAVSIEDRGHYVVQTLRTATGVTVREYLLDDAVFAISWTGAVPPDLHALLGSHFAAYAASLTRLAHPGRQRVVHLTVDDMILNQSGHLRAYQGRAYLPALLPADFAVAELR